MYGEKNHQSKLSAERVNEIRRRHAAGEAGCDRLAREFGVSDTAIKVIVNGRTWKHLLAKQV